MSVRPGAERHARSDTPLPAPGDLLPEGPVEHPVLGALLPGIRARLEGRSGMETGSGTGAGTRAALVVAYYEDAPYVPE